MKSPTKESYTMLKGVRTETWFQFTNISEPFQLNRSLSQHFIWAKVRSLTWPFPSNNSFLCLCHSVVDFPVWLFSGSISSVVFKFYCKISLCSID